MLECTVISGNAEMHHLFKWYVLEINNKYLHILCFVLNNFTQKRTEDIISKYIFFSKQDSINISMEKIICINNIIL